jgi:4a-hydroxytetrahydrobiopterin dehydratase
MAFVNAVAHVAHRQDHHPELAVGYGRCSVGYTTHDAGGVTLNDCICAARIERLAA